jgi:hypothetical protein
MTAILFAAWPIGMVLTALINVAVPGRYSPCIMIRNAVLWPLYLPPLLLLVALRLLGVCRG